MKNLKIWDILCHISVGGLFILFIYSLYIKAYMQAIMCIAFAIAPTYGIITRFKKS